MMSFQKQGLEQTVCREEIAENAFFNQCQDPLSLMTMVNRDKACIPVLGMLVWNHRTTEWQSIAVKVILQKL